MKNLTHNTKHLAIVSTLLFSSPAFGSSALLDFNFQHGTVINNQYTASYGITISANGTPASSPDIAIVYDSELGGANGATINGADPDLERLTGSSTGWEGGNLGSNFNAGGLLIVQENPAQASPPTYGSGANQVSSASNFDPDDVVGSSITFNIDSTNFTYTHTRLLLADFEEDGSNYRVGLTSAIDGDTEIFLLSDFTNLLHPLYDPTITSGDNHINQLPSLTRADGDALSKVEIFFDNSSGAISTIRFDTQPIAAIPEPNSTALLGLSGLGLLLRRRR